MALILQMRCLHRHYFGGFQFHRGIDEHPLDRLEVSDRVTELLPFVRVGIRAVESRFRDPDRERGDADSSAIENGQRLFATASALAEDFRLGVLEAQLGGLARAHSIGMNFSNRRDLVLIMMKALISFLPLSVRPVVAITTNRSATRPLVMKCLSPLTCQ